MRCLVLGGAGFIGGRVVRRLARAGHRVRLLDRQPDRSSPPPPGVECFWSDWSDGPALKRALEGVEIVAHLIGGTWPGHDSPETGGDPAGELSASLGLLGACARAGVRKVVFLSSGGAVYGVARRVPLDERHPTRPICAYGMLKLAVERHLRLYHRRHGLEYLVLRGANVYGEGHGSARPQGAVNVFLRRLAQGRPIEVWGDGRVIRDYLYVGDMARAVELAMCRPLSAGVFNVGSGVGLSLNRLIEACGEQAGVSPRVRYLPARRCDVPVNVLDIAGIRAALGWAPRVALAEGLARTWRWAMSRAFQDGLAGQGRQKGSFISSC